MPSHRAKPEDIIENSPNEHREKNQGESGARKKRNKGQSQGPLPGEDENNLDDRTDSKNR